MNREGEEETSGEGTFRVGCEGLIKVIRRRGNYNFHENSVWSGWGMLDKAGMKKGGSGRGWKGSKWRGGGRGASHLLQRATRNDDEWTERNLPRRVEKKKRLQTSVPQLVMHAIQICDSTHSVDGRTLHGRVADIVWNATRVLSHLIVTDDCNLGQLLTAY